MIDARTKENKSFRLFCIKDPNYVMNIMAIFIPLDDLEVTNTRRDCIYRIGLKEKKNFTCRKLFGDNLGSYIK